MHINTSIVKALMTLKNISLEALGNLAHVTQADMQAWLYDEGKNSEDRVPFDTQLEILKLLGINGETPRNDIVHYWKLHENLFNKPLETYWPLQVLFKAFGNAHAVFLSREADPLFSFQAKAHFGLKFENFVAVLEVTAHPFKSISFCPSVLPEMAWMPEAMGVLLSEDEYNSLEPGSFKVPHLQKYLSYNVEVAQWDKLREVAIGQGLRAEQVAALLAGNSLLVEAPKPISNALAGHPAPSSASIVVEPQLDDDRALFSVPVKIR